MLHHSILSKNFVWSSFRFSVSVPVKRERKNKRFSYTRSHYNDFFSLFLLSNCVSVRKIFLWVVFFRFFMHFSPFFDRFFHFFGTSKLPFWKFFWDLLQNHVYFGPFYTSSFYDFEKLFLSFLMIKLCSVLFQTAFFPPKLLLFIYTIFLTCFNRKIDID